jgi:hypothetical protein
MAAYQQKPNSGTVFKAKCRKSDSHPSGEGSGVLHCPSCHSEVEFWISSWRNTTKSGEPYQKLSFKPKGERQEKTADTPPAEPQKPTGTKFDDITGEIHF